MRSDDQETDPLRELHLVGGMGWTAPRPSVSFYDPIRVADRLAGRLVPRFAEFVAIHLMEESADGGLSRAIMRRIVSIDAAAPGRYREAMPPGEIVRWRRDSRVLLTLSRGGSVHIPHLDGGTADELAAELAVPDLAWVLFSRSVLLLPLRPRSVLLGNILLVRGADKPSFSDDDVAIFENLAYWIGEWAEAIRTSPDQPAKTPAEHPVASSTRSGRQPAQALNPQATPPADAQPAQTPNAQPVGAPDAQAAPTSEGQPVGVPNVQAVRAPDVQTVRAPDVQTVRAPDAQAVRAPDAQAVQAPDVQTVRAPDVQAVPASEGQSARASDVQAVREAGRQAGGGGWWVAQAAFVGRRHELAGARRLLGAVRLVTLTGPAGVGKSCLARRVATELDGLFPEGVHLADLSGVRDPALLAPTVAAALGIPDQDRDPRTWAEHLAGRRLLLLLDTVEHLAADCADLVTTVLRTAPGVRVLTTGRRPLGITGEHTLVIPPLPVPSPTWPDTSGQASEAASGAADTALPDAVVLFARHASMTVPEFRLSPSNLAAVRDICRRLDGLPLAIRLAAEQLRFHPIDELATSLDGGPGEASGEHGDSAASPRRHGSLRAAIGWSHELCDPLQRLLWARLSVFDGDFDLPTAEAVCADEKLPRGEILHVLSELVRNSIVLREKTSASPRYRMLRCMREYGRERLQHLNEAQTFQRRHAARHGTPA